MKLLGSGVYPYTQIVGTIGTGASMNYPEGWIGESWCGNGSKGKTNHDNPVWGTRAETRTCGKEASVLSRLSAEGHS
jgi:hypothetical protein